MKHISVKTQFVVLSPVEFFNALAADPNHAAPAYRLFGTKKSQVTGKKISEAVGIFFSPTWYWYRQDGKVQWSLDPKTFEADYETFTGKVENNLERGLEFCGCDCFLAQPEWAEKFVTPNN